MFYRVSRSSALAPLFLIALPPAAKAQVDEDVIVVSATRQPERLIDVPASVDVLLGEDVRATWSFSTAAELSQRLAGVQVAVANGTQAVFQIRGIGAVDHQALTPGGAAVLVDEIYLATNVQTNALLYDIGRIEVLKGPQGAFYGRNASSGAISFYTIEPGAEQENYLQAELGNFDRVDLRAGVGASLGGQWFGRIAARRLTENPIRDNVQTDPLFPVGSDWAAGELDRTGIRLSLARPGDQHSILARIHYEHDQGVNPAPRNTALDVPRHAISVGPDGIQPTDNQFYGASVRVQSTFTDWDVFNLTAFEAYEQRYGFDFDGTQAPFGVQNLNANLFYDRDFRQYSNELRLSRQWGETNVQLGLLTAYEDFSQDYLIWCGVRPTDEVLGSCRYVGTPGRVGSMPASDGVASSLLTLISQERGTAALFGQIDHPLTPKLRLQIGGRLTYERIDGRGEGQHIFDDGTVALNNRDDLGPARGQNRIIETQPTGTLSLTYAVDPNTNVYGTLSTGYKSGGFNGEVQNNATHFDDEGLFDTETVTSLEFGLKHGSGPVTVSAAAFAQDYDAPQARIFVDFPLPDGGRITSNSLSNLDRATVLGAEAAVDVAISDRLDASLSAVLLDTEISQNEGPEANQAAFDGNPLPFASDVSVVASLGYTHPLTNDASLRIRSDIKYRSEFFLDAEGLEERRQDGYTTWDANLAYRFPLPGDGRMASLSLWGRNLLDEDYAVSGFGFIGYNTFRGDPRRIGVGFGLDL